MSTRPLSIGICPDFAEERWPSMDRVAGQLLAALGGDVDAHTLLPAFRRRATRWSSGWLAYSADRACNRFVDYPRHLWRTANGHDVYHVVDHTYAHLVRSLPAGRSVVTCHDLDAFRSLLEPDQEPRSAPFRAATRFILGGLQRAAVVACDTAAVRDELAKRGLVAAERLAVVPLGVSDRFSAAGNLEADRELSDRLALSPETPIVLHVGSTIPRKRIDVLLRAFAKMDGLPATPHLLRIGDPFTDDQLEMARRLGIGARITVLTAPDDRVLAAAYRRAAVVALPSDREGFGFPVVEALRCGTAVVATDLPVLREVGGAVTTFCPPGDVDAWARTLGSELRRQRVLADQAARVAWADRFTWRRYAERMVAIYTTIAGEQREPRLQASA